MTHSFSFGEFFQIPELLAAGKVRCLNENSVSVVGAVQDYDHVKCTVTIEQAGTTLDVETSLLAPTPFHQGWLFQFIGEVQHAHLQVGRSQIVFVCVFRTCNVHRCSDRIAEVLAGNCVLRLCLGTHRAQGSNSDVEARP